MALSALAQVAPDTHEITLEGTLLFAGEPAWPVVLTIVGGEPFGSGEVVARFECDGTTNPVRITAHLPPGSWLVRTELEEGAGQVGGYLPATGRAFRVDDQGGTTCAINCDHNELFHPLVMDLIAPGRGEMVREPRPLLRWPPVPGAVEYRVTWFEHSYSARSISTGQRIPTQVPEYRFERDLVNERRYEWTVEAIDQSQRTIARSEHRQLHTPGADPEKFRFHPPDGQPGAWLGLQLDFDDAGVFVKAVGPDSPASAAGFEPGDRLLRIRDRTVTGIEVVQWIRTLKPGSRVDMVIMRNGKELSLQPVLGDRNAP